MLRNLEVRRTTEWGTLPLGLGPEDIPEATADRLVREADRCRPRGVGPGQILRRAHRSLEARSVVGIIAAAGYSVEILPKTDSGQNGDPVKGKQILVRMLEVALDVPIAVGQAAPVDWNADSLLDILIRAFVDLLLEAARHGMPRSYVAHTDDLPALRGRLDATRQFTTLVASPGRLACRFDELSVDIPLNRVIKAALRKLVPLAQKEETSRRLRELICLYGQVRDLRPAYLSRPAFLDRGSERWKPILNLASLFLGDRFQSTHLGTSHGISLLFDMGKLFESYIARQLARGLAHTDLRVAVQSGFLTCLAGRDGFSGLFQTRPDLIVRRGEKIVLIADTKWKLLVPSTLDRKQGIAQADVYQMMAYGQLYDCDRLLLIYPQHQALTSQYSVQHRLTNVSSRLSWGTIELNQVAALPAALCALVNAAID